MKHLSKSVLSLILTISVFLSLLLTPVFAAEFKTLQKGSNGEDVRQLQQALIGQGYLSGTADGDFGDMTRTAVTKFQTDNGLSATGVADSATLTLLYQLETERKGNIVLKNGDSSEDVRAVKQRLVELGYLFGFVNSTFDDEMETAVKAFQNRNGLNITGKVDKAVREALYATNVVKASKASTVVPYYVQILNRYSYPYLKVTFTNKGNDIIDAIDYHVRVYNVYGDRLLVYDKEPNNYNIEEEYAVFQFGRTFYPNTMMGMNRNEEISLNHYRDREGEAISSVKVAVSRFHTQDGYSYTIPEHEWVWYDSNGQTEILPPKVEHGQPCGTMTAALRERADQIKLGVKKWLLLWDYSAEVYDMPYGGLFLSQHPDAGLLYDGGLKRSDTITNVDGYEIYTPEDLSFALAEGSKDGKVEMTYFRNSVEQHITLNTEKYVSKELSEAEEILPATPTEKPVSSEPDKPAEKTDETVAQNTGSSAENDEKKALYQDAMYLYIDGKYEEALQKFSELGDYERSEEFVAKCTEALAESLVAAETSNDTPKNVELSDAEKAEIYQSAMYLFIEEQYAEAKAEFEKLGDYERSLEFIAKCEEKLIPESVMTEDATATQNQLSGTENTEPASSNGASTSDLPTETININAKNKSPVLYKQGGLMIRINEVSYTQGASDIILDMRCDNSTKNIIEIRFENILIDGSHISLPYYDDEPKTFDAGSIFDFYTYIELEDLEKNDVIDFANMSCDLIVASDGEDIKCYKLNIDRDGFTSLQKEDINQTPTESLQINSQNRTPVLFNQHGVVLKIEDLSYTENSSDLTIDFNCKNPTGNIIEFRIENVMIDNVQVSFKYDPTTTLYAGNNGSARDYIALTELQKNGITDFKNMTCDLIVAADGKDVQCIKLDIDRSAFTALQKAF